MTRGQRIDPKEDLIEFDLVEHALRTAIVAYGGQGKVAKAAGIDQSLISNVLARRRLAPNKLLAFLKLGQYTVRGYYELEEEKP